MKNIEMPPITEEDKDHLKKAFQILNYLDQGNNKYHLYKNFCSSRGAPIGLAENIFDILIQHPVVQELWDVLNKDQRDEICEEQTLSESFIEAHWNGMTEEQQVKVFEYQEVSESFICDKWNNATEEQRDEICIHQKLSEEFLNKHWNEFTEEEILYICECQNLSPDFIGARWSALNTEQKSYICKYQKDAAAPGFSVLVDLKNDPDKDIKTESIGLGR